MTKLKSAYENWRNQQPLLEYGNCCNRKHNDYDNSPKHDDNVCDRELAWRVYVRIRDNNPGFPFVHSVTTSGLWPTGDNWS